MFHSLTQVEAFFYERRTLGIIPGLERMDKLLESQNNPEKRLRAIHIAGTNGKGSTLTYLKDALQANHYRVGVFTSPSLTGLTGHILVDDQPINTEQFLSLFNALLPTIDQLDEKDMPPTEFEILTTIAFMYFSDSVDITIIEAGMGGREDTTNCIKPIVSIITNIAMDHAHFLGDTLEEIAYHKAGIIKENVPTILGNINASCFPVIQHEANMKQSQIYQLKHEFDYMNITSESDVQSFYWKWQETVLEVSIKMKGLHQVENASTAIMTLKLLEENGFNILWDRARTALQTSQLAGRFEKISAKPPVILDGAHNPEGIKAFLKTVQREYGDQKSHLIFAGFRDKELVKMVRLALPYFDSVTITSFDHPRAEDPYKLANSIISDKLDIHPDWRQLVSKVLNVQDGKNENYFFAGSLHFIGTVRTFILGKSS